MAKERGVTDAGEPRPEYLRRLEARRSAAAALDRRHVLLGNAKLATAAAGALLAWLAFGRHWRSGWWLLAPGAVFVVLSVLHERVLRARRRAGRAVAFYERAMARLEDRWPGTGEGGSRFDDPAHPYAEDLDLFGNGSLFELLSTARLQVGEETLASWLLAPAGIAEIGRRHEAVRELAPLLDLREDLALLGEDLRSGINPRSLARWAEQPLLLDSRRDRVLAFVLSIAALIAAVLWAVAGVPEVLLAVAVVEAGFYFRLRWRIAKVVERVGDPAYGLALFSEVLGRLEREHFRSPLLKQLRTRLETRGVPASRSIARLNRLMELLDSGDNVVLKVVGPPLLWTTQLAFALEAWRKRHGPAVRRWLEAAGEMEALCALANFAWEHPRNIFPEFVDGEPRFEGEALAHPLLPESRSISNDVRLGGELSVLVVSGSNMSGKSTLLRTVGINAVLAMAGAPVRAARMRLTPLAVGASIRTLDSLQGGTSRFYAEITRLRQLLDLTRGPLPLLFLLDELLNGTNSHDRRIGSEAVVRSLIRHGALGLLTTHDLALAHIADVLAPRAANVHFEDYLEDGKISFDYRLRPGVVRKSNALELMRSVGLEV